MIDFLSYFLILAVTFLGLLVGIIVAELSAEEKEPLKKHIRFSRILIFVVFDVLLLYLTLNQWLLFLFIIIVSLIFLFFKHSSFSPYNVLGILFYVGSHFIEFFVLTSVLLFLISVLEGIQCCPKRNRKEYLVFFGKRILFVLIALILPLAFSNV